MNNRRESSGLSKEIKAGSVFENQSMQSNTLEASTHVTISTDAEKACDKIHHLFMIKTPKTCE